MNDTGEVITTLHYDLPIHRYLAGRMDAAEKALFEVRMLEEPELLERVQLLEALTVELTAEQSALLTGEGAAEFRVLPFRQQVRQPFALAASVLVAVLGVQALISSPQGAPNAVPVGELLLLETRRDESVPVFTGAGPFLFQIDASSARSDDVDLTLIESSSGQTRLRQESVAVDAEGWARLLYTGTLNGEYRIEIQGAPAYRFSVQNP